MGEVEGAFRAGVGANPFRSGRESEFCRSLPISCFLGSLSSFFSTLWLYHTHYAVAADRAIMRDIVVALRKIVSVPVLALERRVVRHVLHKGPKGVVHRRNVECDGNSAGMTLEGCECNEAEISVLAPYIDFTDRSVESAENDFRPLQHAKESFEDSTRPGPLASICTVDSERCAA
jgi:hypothetical protein